LLRRSRTDHGGDDLAGARLLVVNDDEGGCELVARILESAGFVATRLHSHADAVLALNKPDQNVDGVIIDFTGGGASSSLKLLDSVRHGVESNREIPTLILATSPNNRIFAFQTGADAFMVRPFHADDLVTEVRRALALSADDREAHRQKMLESEHLDD